MGWSCGLLLKRPLESCDNTCRHLELVTTFSFPSCIGCPRDSHCLRSYTETICALARKLHSDFSALSASDGGCGNELPRADCEELESLAKSLLLCFECGETPGLLKPWESCTSNSKEEHCKSDRTDCNRRVPKRVYELHGDTTPAVSSGDCTPNRIQWV